MPEHYFEMSKFDAKRALSIYKTFSRQTNQVVEYLSTARTYENATRLEIPKLKHAPTSLTGSLEEYLNDPDFEINRRQYLAQQEAKKGRKNTVNGNGEFSGDATKFAAGKEPESSQAFQHPTEPPPPPAKPEPKGPAPDLIDFFDSIEKDQKPPVTQYQQQNPVIAAGPQFFQSQQVQQPQLSGLIPQPHIFSTQNDQFQQQTMDPSSKANGNAFGQPQPPPSTQQNFTGSNFSGFAQQAYNQQPGFSPGLAQQNTTPNFAPSPLQQQQQQQYPVSPGQQPQSTNPFRQSIMPQNTGGAPSSFTGAAPPLPTSHAYQSTNPFGQNLVSHTSGQPNQSTPFMSPPPQTQSPPFTSPRLQSQNTAQFPPQPLQPSHTATNPFARSSVHAHPTPTPLMPTQTGSTNPFRQSNFPHHQTGQGWQAGQGSMGGLENLETIPVFPRPGQSPSGVGNPWR